MKSLRRPWIVLVLVFVVPGTVFADALNLTTGTPVYAELVDQVTSRKKETAVGDVIEARVWKDVVVDDQVLIEEGSELLLRVAHVEKSKFLGRKGHLVLEAISAQAIDGSVIPLTGHQYRGGKGRKTVTGVLAVAVAWPFLFLKGKNAAAPAGTVIEAWVDEDTLVYPSTELAYLH